MELTAKIDRRRATMVEIPAGTFTMGSDRHYPEEGPAHEVAVDAFWMDRAPVTNAEFGRFVAATGWVTVAERAPRAEDYPGAHPELLVPASIVFVKPWRRVGLGDHHAWWAYVPGADWRHPRGPTSSIEGLADHPVVHVACEDAEAYARWCGKALPTEAEWERAARGGLEGKEFAWGDDLVPGGRRMANFWDAGEFPYERVVRGRWDWTTPVGSFPENGYGLVDMIGNVWEWTCDWYQPRHAIGRTCCHAPPREGLREASYDPATPQLRIPRRVMKGGSFLCSPGYCRRYRPAARMAQPIDTSTCHLGFRCVIRTSLTID
jgi:formylglycine-generating enzyme required for sulfatase activity